MSITSFTPIIIVVNAKLLLESRAFTAIQGVLMAGTSIGLYLAWMWVSNSMIEAVHGTILQAHKSPLFYLSIILVCGICFTLDFTQ
jgi:hypothetical protein